VYQQRMCAVITQASYTLALLEEAERFTELLYELSRYSERWRFLLGKDAYRHQNAVVCSVQHLIRLLLEPELLKNAVKPASKQEEELCVAASAATASDKPRTPTPTSTSVLASASSASSSIATSAVSTSADGVSRDRSFRVRTLRSVYRVLRNGLSMVRQMSAGMWQEQQLRDPDSKLIMFAPTRHSQPGEPPSLGLFLRCLSVNNYALKRADTSDSDRRLLHYLQESVLHIVLGQMQLCLSSAPMHARAQLRDDIGSDLDASLSRLLRIAPNRPFYVLASKFLKRLFADLAPHAVSF
jgi:hypothetical protein